MIRINRNHAERPRSWSRRTAVAAASQKKNGYRISVDGRPNAVSRNTNSTTNTAPMAIDVSQNAARGARPENENSFPGRILIRLPPPAQVDASVPFWNDAA